MASFYLSDSEFNQMQKMVFGEKNKKENNDDFLISSSPKTEKKQGILADFIDSVQMGAWQGVGDLSRAVGVTFDSDWFNEVADWAAKGADEQLETMSPEMREALGQSALDGAGKGMLNARWWAGNIGAIIGSNLDAVATFGAGKLATTGMKQIGKYAGNKISKKAAEKIGEIAAEQAIKRGLPQKYANAIGLSAVMSAMGAGNRANNAIEEYLGLPDNEVVNHDIFRQTYHDLKNSEEGQGIAHDVLFDMAKERTAHQIGKSAALNPAAVLTDLGVNAAGGLGGGFMGVLDPAKTLKGGLLKGALTEGGTEAIQGGVEQYAINKAAQENYDPNRDLMQGVQDNVVNSTILGAGFGSPMGLMDTVSGRIETNRRQEALENRKVELLQMVNTGNEAVDAQLRSYVDMINRNATELRELVSASKVQALNQAGREKSAVNNTDSFADNPVRYSLSEDPNSAFAKAVDNFVNGDQVQKIINIGTTPNVLKMIGLPDVNVNISREVLSKVMRGKHSIEPETLKQLPQQINDPIAIFQSSPLSSNPNSYVVLTELTEFNNDANIDEPIIAALSIKQNGEVSFIDVASAYGKNLRGLQNILNKDKAYYWNKEKGQRLSDNFELQLSPSLSSKADLSANNIKTETDLSQYQSGKPDNVRHSFAGEYDNNPRFSRSSLPADYDNEYLVLAERYHNGDQSVEPRLREMVEQKARQWAKKSKVVDENGNPSIVYHGTAAEKINEFDYDRIGQQGTVDGQGFYFAASKDFAEDYRQNGGTLIQAYLNMPNALDSKKVTLTKANVKSIIKNLDPEGYDYLSNFGDVDYEGYNNVLNEAVKNAFESSDNDIDLIGGIINAEGSVERVYAALEKAKGQSGIVAKKDSGDTHYVVGNPNQIKSSELVTYNDNGNIIPLSQRFNSESRDIRFSLSESPDSDFAKAVDSVVNGSVPQGRVSMGKTPDVLKMLGLPDTEIRITGGTIQKVMGEHLGIGQGNYSHIHNLTPETLKKLPQQINNPIAIFNSSTRKNAYVILTELTEVDINTGKEKPVVSALHINIGKGNVEVIDVRSVYGRGDNQLSTAFRDDLLYLNKAKGQQFLKTHPLQLHWDLTSDANLSTRNIKTETDLSQYQSKKNTPNSNIDTERFTQIVTKAVGESAVENINVIQSGTKPEGMQQLITADVEGWFDPKTNKITLVADGIQATRTMTREERIAWVAWHELAHRGVNVRLKGEYKSIMHRADSHQLINTIASAIQQERQGKNDSAATSRHIAVEEAIAEVFAAYQTGQFNELANRYGVNMTDKGFKVWLKNFAEKVRALIDKLFGRETVERFTDNDLVNLFAEIKSAIDSNNTFSESNNDFRFSLNEDVNSDFAKAVEAIIQGKSVQGYVNVGTTPDVLKMLGLPDVNVTIHGSTFKKVMQDKHNVTSDTLKKLPSQINDPVAVMGSSTKDNSYIVLTELVEQKNDWDKPVIAALHLKQDKNGLELINIASVYGRSKSQVQRGLNENLLYWNNKKGTEFVNTFGLQLPAYASQEQSVGSNIKTEADLSQYRSENGSNNVSEGDYEKAKAEGKTELTFKQWQQVRTPAFKKWFGDWEKDPQNASKVINPRTGEPLVVYHGSKNKFFEFDTDYQFC